LGKYFDEMEKDWYKVEGIKSSKYVIGKNIFATFEIN
jgi:hypothetical protein